MKSYGRLLSLKKMIILRWILLIGRLRRSVSLCRQYYPMIRILQRYHDVSEPMFLKAFVGRALRRGAAETR